MVLRTATKDENVPRPRTLIMVAIEAELRWDRGRGRSEVLDNAPSGGWVEIKLTRTPVSRLCAAQKGSSISIGGSATFRPSALAVTRAPVVTSLATRKGRTAVSATVVRRVPDRDT